MTTEQPVQEPLSAAELLGVSAKAAITGYGQRIFNEMVKPDLLAVVASFTSAVSVEELRQAFIQRTGCRPSDTVFRRWLKTAGFESKRQPVIVPTGQQAVATPSLFPR